MTMLPPPSAATWKLPVKIHHLAAVVKVYVLGGLYRPGICQPRYPSGPAMFQHLRSSGGIFHAVTVFGTEIHEDSDTICTAANAGTHRTTATPARPTLAEILIAPFVEHLRRANPPRFT
jgi:hypothetical protein